MSKNKICCWATHAKRGSSAPCSFAGLRCVAEHEAKFANIGRQSSAPGHFCRMARIPVGTRISAKKQARVKGRSNLCEHRQKENAGEMWTNVEASRQEKCGAARKRKTVNY